MKYQNRTWQRSMSWSRLKMAITQYYASEVLRNRVLLIDILLTYLITAPG